MIKINGTTLQFPDYILTDAGVIRTAKRRVSENTTVYGANGDYVVYDEAYESQDRTLKFSVSTYEKIVYLTNLFNDNENEIEFDYLPNSKFHAELEEITYSKHGQYRWSVDIKLIFDPFRYSVDVGVTTLSKSGTINNLGDVFSEPIIEIEGNGEISLTIGKQTMALNLDTKARIDCRHRRQNIYDKNNNVKNSIRTKGGFFEIQPGLNGVSTSGNVASVKIYGNWRWRI
ncbi:phage tail component protein [Gemella bergeri ATCC 700627]|uniref:Phage tail component protein n=1 Tax=Gemella bergeri ATCC 700627 TaxID=1321820 RepID=U2Q4W7_9BACL|nr:phage tail domain-containing protein [Gemella bergeri]ERK57820.1 phage tail component protein [Gemella bergeri ATCC 700627]